VTLLETTIAAIAPVDEAAARAAQDRLDRKTKPRRSLGRLEELACRLAAVFRTADPVLPAKAVAVLVADHGIAAEGVSAYPQEVTVQMMRNFLTGGAAINVLARQHGARVVLVDMGTRSPIDTSGEVRALRLGSGTANCTHGPAMSRAIAVHGLEAGILLATELQEANIGLLGVGEMGIGNTTSASALTAVLTGERPERVTGRGTGIDDERLHHKVRTIERALEANRPSRADPLGVLAAVGGFEIAGLAGLMLGGAARRVPVVLDGFITGAAALVAVALCPAVRNYLVASHRSVEPGHRIVLEHLGLRPLLDLDLRLGEGTGAVLAMNLAEASLRLLREMATFTAAGVTDAGA
jgi:nicotinate-nucleotide--dimethylbenzimidazole phosphoribosyltransferase